MKHLKFFLISCVLIAVMITNTQGQTWNQVPTTDDIFKNPVEGNIGMGTTTPLQKVHIYNGFPINQATSGGPFFVNNKPAVGIRFQHDIASESVINPGTFNVRSTMWDIQTFNSFSSGNVFQILKAPQVNYTTTVIEGHGPSFLSNSGPAGPPTLSPVLTINGAGNLGIGTTTPSSPLTVAGYIQSTNGGYIFPDGTIQSTAMNPNAQWTPSGSNIFYNVNGGNVGIGASSPEYKLTIKGDYGSSQMLITNNHPDNTNNHNGIFFEADGADSHHNWLIGQQKTVGGLEFTPSSAVGGTTFPTPAMVILNNGKIGIGTISPTSGGGGGDGKVLQIEGSSPALRLNNTAIEQIDFTIRATNGAARLLSNKGMMFFIDEDNNGNDGYFDIYDKTNSLSGGGKRLFHFNNSGSLDICGTMRSSGMILEIFSGCDFVFQPEYEPMNWKEKQMYYLTHQRLPYMKAAKEMEEKGMDVSETMKGVLQNIEEDRLDITELFKRLEKLEKENGDLKNEIEALKK